MLNEAFTIQRALILGLLLSIPFQICYLVTRLVFVWAFQSKATEKEPPTLPYYVPILGSALSYIADPLKFVTARGTAAPLGPLRIKFFTREVVLLRGPDDIEQLWRQSRLSSFSALSYFALRRAFGMREQSARRYLLNDSGNSARPYPDSNIPAHNRVEYMSHKGLHDLLLGKGLVPFFERFERVLSARLPLLECGDEWIERRDLVEFMALELTPTMLTAMCGPGLLQQSPDFPRLFWEYNESLPTLFKGLPRWSTPKACARRDSLLESIKTWQRYAIEETSKINVQSDGEEVPFWGSRYFRDRQKTLLAVDGYDGDAVASEMLGTIWAFNTNAILASIWATLNVFLDPEVLARVRSEVALCRSESSESGLCIDKLLQQPLLQSVYAETLRLRVHIYITWYSYHDRLNIGDRWIVPPKTVVVVPTTPAHFDEEAWNTGHDGRHPINTFWADRFLVVPGDDEKLGPMKPPHVRAPGRDPRESGTFFSEPKAHSGSWFPFGGGVHMCLGRQFAKRMALLTLAMMTRDFDIEITADAAALEMDMAAFGQGTQRPKGKVPFRIRRRRGSDHDKEGVAQQMQM